MSVEVNKALVRRYIDLVKNRHGDYAQAVDELFAPDVVFHVRIPGLPPGGTGLKALFGAVIAAFPDVQVTVEHMVAEGDMVAERTLAHGTNKGSLMGIPPSGQVMHWSENHIYRIQNGKIAEMWSEGGPMG